MIVIEGILLTCLHSHEFKNQNLRKIQGYVYLQGKKCIGILHVQKYNKRRERGSTFEESASCWNEEHLQNLRGVSYFST